MKSKARKLAEDLRYDMQKFLEELDIKNELAPDRVPTWIKNERASL